MNNGVKVLIVAKPGRIRDSLTAIIRALPSVEMIKPADNCVAAFSVVTQHRPNLLIANATPSCEVCESYLTQIKLLFPQTRLLFLVDSYQQRRIAEEAGADAVLLNGFSMTQLYDTVAQVLV